MATTPKLDPIDHDKHRDEVVYGLSGSSGPTKTGAGQGGRFNSHGYVPAAMMFNTAIKDMRDHVEYEKFLCRTVKDDARTRLFKTNTEQHPDSKYRMMYNSASIEEHTIVGKKKLAEDRPDRSE